MSRLHELCDEQRSQSAEFVEDDGWQRLVAERHQVRLTLNPNPNIPILIPNPIPKPIPNPILTLTLTLAYPGTRNPPATTKPTAT